MADNDPRPSYRTDPASDDGSQKQRREELHIIAEHAVEETLTRMGLDASDPIEVQKDLAWLRRWRHSSEKIQTKSLGTVIGVVISGALGLVWLGVTALIGK